MKNTHKKYYEIVYYKINFSLLSMTEIKQLFSVVPNSTKVMHYTVATCNCGLTTCEICIWGCEDFMGKRIQGWCKQIWC